MKISIEISLYPLAHDRFKKEIWAFINRLNEVQGLKVETNGMSTQVFGDYDLATSHVMAEIKHVPEPLDAAVFLVKFIGGDRSQVIPEDQC